MLAMPMFDDSAIDMKELLSRLAEQVANDVMDAEADQLCGGAGRTAATAAANKAPPHAWACLRCASQAAHR